MPGRPERRGQEEGRTKRPLRAAYAAWKRAEKNEPLPVREAYGEWKRDTSKRAAVNAKSENQRLTLRIRTALRTFRVVMQPSDTFKCLVDEVAEVTDWHSHSRDNQKQQQRLSRHPDGRSFVHGVNKTLADLAFKNGDML